MTRFGTRLTAGPVTLAGPMIGTTGLRINIADASPIVIDASLSETLPRKIFFVQLTAGVGATRELSNFLNLVDMQVVAVLFRQSSAGNNAVTLDSKFRLCENVPDFNLTLTAYAQCLAGFIYDANEDAILVAALDKNFAD